MGKKGCVHMEGRDDAQNERGDTRRACETDETNFEGQQNKGVNDDIHA